MALKYSETRVLIVGAGAIGQIYGHHLQKGGDKVAVLIRPHHEAKAKEGYTLHRLGLAGKRANYDLFKPYRILTNVDQVPGEIWSAVWLCVPTPVLREPWIAEVLRVCRGATIVVTAMSDREYLKTLVPEETIVTFMVSLVSYPGPLEGEDFWPPGMVYYFPPLSPSGFEGDKHRAMACVNELARGGMPSKWQDNVAFKTESASALLMPFVLGLELEGWSINQLRESSSLAWVLGAHRELLSLAQNKHQVAEVPTGQRFLLKLLDNTKGMDLFKWMLKMVPKMVPFPFDAYMDFHFTKIRTQTHELMQKHLAEGARLQLPMPQLEALYSKWTDLVGAAPALPATATAPTTGTTPVLQSSAAVHPHPHAAQSHEFTAYEEPVLIKNNTRPLAVVDASGHEFPAAHQEEETPPDLSDVFTSVPLDPIPGELSASDSVQFKAYSTGSISIDAESKEGLDESTGPSSYDGEEERRENTDPPGLEEPTE